MKVVEILINIEKRLSEIEARLEIEPDPKTLINKRIRREIVAKILATKEGKK